MMVVTRLEEMEQSKVRVYIDEEYAFLLYQKDIKRFKIKEGEEIASELYEKIMEDTIYRRAKQKAVAILSYMNRSEQELRSKLTDTGYPHLVVERTIAYVIEYGYLNDERFAAAYVRTKMKTKSKMVIKTNLLQKGIKKEIIDSIFMIEYGDEANEDVELLAIKKAISVKTKFPENLTPLEKQKLMASLYRKGFEITKIKQILL